MSEVAHFLRTTTRMVAAPGKPMRWGRSRPHCGETRNQGDLQRYFLARRGRIASRMAKLELMRVTPGRRESTSPWIAS